MAEPTETESATPAPATPEATSGGAAVDLANRPDAAWLDGVEGDIDDVDLVLKCLARNSTAMCDPCTGLSSSGELESRTVLAHCASTKQ